MITISIYIMIALVLGRIAYTYYQGHPLCVHVISILLEAGKALAVATMFSAILLGLLLLSFI